MFKEKMLKIARILFNFIKKHRVSILFIIVISLGYYYRNFANRTKYLKNKSEIVKNENVSLDEEKISTLLLVNRNLYGKTEKEKKKFILTNFDMDNYIISNKSAPVTIIDYSSFTCVFCKSMREEMKKIIEEFVEEKKVVNYVLRPFYGRKTLPFGALLLCADLDKRESMAEEFFNINVNKINNVEDIKKELVEIGVKYGINAETARKCINDEGAYDRIIYMQNESEAIFDLTKSPLLIINGKEYYGYKNYNQLKDIIEKNLKKNAR